MTEQVEAKHFLEYWRVLASRKETVLAVAFFVVIAGLVFTLSMDKEYSASTRMSIRTIRTDLPVFEPQEKEPTYNPFFLKTQLEVLQSQLVLDQVIQNLDLQTKFARAHKLNRMTIPEVRRELIHNLRVMPELDTSIIQIKVSRRQPRDTVRQDVRDIANEIADIYVSVTTQEDRRRTQRALEELHKDVEKYDKLVADKEKEVEQLRSDSKINLMARANGEGEAVERLRLQQLEGNRVLARNEMLDKKARIDRLNSLNVKQDDLLYTLGYMLSDPTLRTLRHDLTDAEMKLKLLSEDHGPKHPDVIKNEAAIEELNKEIADALQGARIALQTDYDIAKRNYEEIENDLTKEKEDDIKRSGEQYLPFNKAEQELTYLREVRDSLNMRWIQHTVDTELPQTPVTIIDHAEEPSVGDYTSPNIPLNVVLSILVGLGCGVGIAFFGEYVDTSVKSVEEIEQNIGLPVLGAIPQKMQHLIESGEGNPSVEAYRVLRTNIQLSKRLGGSKAICVTSGGAGEGKSFTLSNLAYVAAQQGDKVLVVDSDMRRPRQHRIFGVQRKPGLSDVLRGDATVESVIQKTTLPRLFVLPSGQSAVGSAGLLDSQRMRDVVDYLKGQFDLLLFDAPPIIGVSDASVLVSKVDSVLLVIQHRSYPRAVSARAKKMIEDVGGNLLGAVLNSVNIARDYYYYHSYAGQYSYSESKSRLLVNPEHADEEKESPKRREKRGA